jgi:uncharacterized protein YukE
MAFEGMDVDQVTQVLQHMTSLQQQLQSVVSAMPGVVSSLEGAWKGPDAQRFAAEWPSHQSQLNGALAGLETMVHHTQANLHEQVSASQNY